MPRTVIIQDAKITQVDILPAETGYLVRINYNLRDETQAIIQSKIEVRYSANATSDGTPLNPKLPANMETKLNELLATFQSGITTLEGL